MAAVVDDRRLAAIERRCRQGLDVAALGADVLRLLRQVMSVDAAFFATVDPATLLFTSAVAEEPLAEATPLFMDNEFGRPDVNKFTTLAASSDPVSSLDRATAAHRRTSARYVEVMAPLGLGDELRAALVVGGRCWGVMCLHREDSPLGFDEREVRAVRRLVPHLAEGLRRSVLTEAVSDEPTSDGPGLLVLDDDLRVISMNPSAEQWLAEAADVRGPHTAGLPVAVYTAVMALTHSGGPEPEARPVTRLRTATGHWLTVHASRLKGKGGDSTAVVLEPAPAPAVGSLVLEAHGLTQAQTRVATLVLRGYSTRQIVNELHISAHTVQEHLGAVFEKFGIGSRRQLVAILLGHRH